MKRIMWIYLVVACFHIVLLSVSAVLLRINFSNSDFSSIDLIYMFSRSTWFYLAFLPLSVLLIRKLDKRFSVIIPFTLAMLLLVTFELVQYPSIFFWDTFYHSATTKYVIRNGSFSNKAGYYEYPGTFFISATLSEVLGLSVLSSNLFFAAFLNVLIVFLLFVIGRIFGGREHVNMEMSWLVPTIYLVFSFRFYNGNHFSPQLLGLCLYIFFTYICLKTFFLKARIWRIFVLILVAVLTTIHVFSALFSVATLLCIYAVEKIRQLKLNSKQFMTLTVLMTTIVLFVSWHIFVATKQLTDTASFLPSILRGERTLSGFVKTVVKPIHGPFASLLTFYRYGIYGLFTFASICTLLLHRRKTEVKLLFSMGIGILFGGVATYLTPATFGVGRALFYAGVIISILSSYIIANRRVRSLSFKRATGILKIILPFLVIGTFLVSHLYYSTYISFIHPDEMKVAEFAAENVRKQISVEVETSLVVRFYADVPVPVLRVDKRTDNSTIAKMKIEKSDLNLQYLPRQLSYFNLTFIENKSSLIYSNGLGRIYAKTYFNIGS